MLADDNKILGRIHSQVGNRKRQLGRLERDGRIIQIQIHRRRQRDKTDCIWLYRQLDPE